MDPHPHQPGDSKRSPPPPATEPRQHPKKHKKLRMSGRNQRMAPTDRMGGDDMKAKGFEGPHYRVTDQDWKMSDFPDPLLPRPDLSTSLPPDMTRETERGFYAYLQICKDKAREADERKAAEKKAAAKRITE